MTAQYGLWLLTMKMIPPFGKGGPGGISEAIHLKISLDPPVPKGGAFFSYSGVNAGCIHDCLRVHQHTFNHRSH